MKICRSLQNFIGALLVLSSGQAAFAANDTSAASPSGSTVSGARLCDAAIPTLPSASTVRSSRRTSRSLDEKKSILQCKSDPYSPGLSPEAVQLADILHITDKLKKVQQLQQQIAQFTDQKPPVELRQDLTDLKLDLLQIIEQTQLDIDFVASEIEEEDARFLEWLRTFEEDRDNRVNRANINAFRTNGVLWAVAEALDIPTYAAPKYSIPSGALGIIAGLVPSVFSEYAVRVEGGGKYVRNAHPNMLSKIYGFPTHEGIEYPESVWTYLNTPPPEEGEKRSRRDLLIDHWLTDQNIHIFKNGASKDDLVLLTGASQPKVSIDLLHDRLTMLCEVEAVSLQMHRPLLELNMALQGKKKMPE